MQLCQVEALPVGFGSPQRLIDDLQALIVLAPLEKRRREKPRVVRPPELRTRPLPAVQPPVAQGDSVSLSPLRPKNPHKDPCGGLPEREAVPRRQALGGLRILVGDSILAAFACQQR